MTAIRLYELRVTTLAWLMAGMALSTAAFVSSLPIWLMVAITALGATLLWRSWHGRPPPRLGFLRMLLLSAVAIGLFWATGRLGVGLDGASPLFVSFLWFKLLELHGPRDVMRTCFLSLFLVTAQLLVAQSLAQSLYAAASSLAILGVLVHLHVVGPMGAGADGQPLRSMARSMRTAAIIVAQALPFVAVMFILIPRPDLSPGIDQNNAASGVTDSLDPGAIAEVAKNTQTAFRVEFTGGRAPSPLDCYWRGVVLWHTDGNTWDRRSQSPRGPDIDAGIAGQFTVTASSAEHVSYAVAMQPHRRRWLYTLDCPTAIVRGTGLKDVALKAGVVMEQRTEEILDPLVYQAESDLGASAHDWDGGSERDDHRFPYYVLPPARVDPRIRDLARRFRATATHDGVLDGGQAIAAALDWFRAEKFIYTLAPGEMGPNATATFLFEKKRGFCGHYASAFSLLMRLANLPSRVVIGYYGGEINAVGGFMTIRHSNAHAWSEVWIDGSGWRRVDATEAAVAVDDLGNVIPAESQADRRAFSSSNHDNTWLGRRLKAMRDRWDYIEAKWDRWALGYDAETLDGLLKRFGIDGWGGIGIFALLVACCALLLGAVVLGMRRRRRARDPAVTLFGAFCQRLARVGVERSASEGPVDFARRASERVPDHADRIARITESYIGARYSGEHALKRE
ncbi:MAG: DUF3488 domain-containing transglutaminase family protein, partial [Planctomycetes bacterium]|nr:DUF3488 domain-containing transglutaminase family protein [Planctomycetota bacterium]